MKRLIFCMMAVLFSIGGFAQDIVTVGEGTNTSTNCYAPSHLYYSNSTVQILYLADEIGMPGSISSIAFQQASTSATRHYKIYMAHTDKTSFSSTSDYVPEGDFSLVYDGNVSFTSGSWTTIELDETYAYDGANNLCVAVLDVTGSYLSTSYWLSSTGTGYTGRVIRSYQDDDLPTGPTHFLNSLNLGDYIPNTQFGIIPSGGDFCYAPGGLQATEITSESITITWNEAQDASGYNLQIKTEDQSWDDVEDEVYTTSDLEYTFTDLLSSTKYNIRVQSDCESAWKNILVATACDITPLPYTQGFESGEALCWDFPAVYSDYPKITTSYPATGTKSLEFQSSSTILATAVLPPFEAPLNELRLSFQTRPEGSSSGELKVGYITNADNVTTFVPVVSLPKTDWDQMVFTTQIVDFNGVELDDYEGVRIAFQYDVTNGSSSWYWYVDDVQVDYIPECSFATGLTVSDITESSAVLHWSGNENTTYTIYYKTVSEDEWSTVEGVDHSAEGFLLEDLADATTYQWYLVSDCDEDAVSSTSTFTTLMGPAELPYESTFGEDDPWLFSSTSSLGWTIGNPGTYASDFPTAMFVATAGSTTPGYNITSSNVVCAEKTFEVGDATTINLSFDAVVGGESLYDYLKVYVDNAAAVYAAGSSTTFGSYSHSTNALAFNNNTSYPYILNLTAGSVYHYEGEVDLPQNDGVIKVVFVWKNDGSGGEQPGAIVSNINISTPACFKPIVAIDETTTSSATFTATSNVDNFLVQYKPVNAEEEEMIEEVVSSEFTLDDLESGTQYQIEIAAICDDGSYSSSVSGTFTTMCEDAELPITWGFEADEVNKNICWKLYTNYSSGLGYSTVHQSGEKSLYIQGGANYNYYFQLPPFDVDQYPIETLSLSAFARAGGNGCKIIAGTMEEGSTSTFIAFDSVDIPNAGTDFSPVVLDLMNYDGEQGSLAFRVVAPSTVYLDDVKLDLTPECPIPTNLALVYTTSNSAIVNWQGDESMSYTIFVKGPEDEEFQTLVEGASINEEGVEITGLEPQTTYQWYVATECGGTYAVSMATLTFTTACTEVTEFPWEEGFEDGTIGCFILEQIAGSATWSICSTTSGSQFAVIDGNYSVYFPYTTGASARMVSPIFDLTSLTTPMLTYSRYMKPYLTTQCDSLVVYYRTSPDAEWQYLHGTAQPNTEYETIETVLPEPSATYQIAFVGLGLNAYYFFLDDIKVSEAPDCMAPTVVVTDVTVEGASVTVTGNSDSYLLSYKVAGTNEWIEEGVEVVDTYELTDFTPATTYTVQVAPACDETLIATINFTTPCGVFPIPFADDFELDATGSMPQCWNAPIVYSGYPKVTSSSYAIGSRVLEFHATTAAPATALLPIFQDPINQLRLKMQTRPEGSSSGALKVGYMTDENDPSSFVAVATFSKTDWSSPIAYETRIVDFNSLDLEDYEGVRIALQYDVTNGSSSYYWYVDDVQVDYVPACQEPSALTETNITSTSAILNWNGNEDLTYTIFVKGPEDEDFVIADEGVSMSEDGYELYDLQPATYYNWYVATECEDGSLTASLSAGVFMTECVPVTEYPWQEGFEDGFGCMTLEQISGSETWSINTDAAYVNTGSKSVKFPWSTGASARMITPTFDLTSLTTPMLTYAKYMKPYSTPARCDSLAIYYRTSPEAEWQYLTGDAQPHTGFVIDTVLLPEPSETYQIAFVGLGLNALNFYLDDIMVSEAPACFPPSLTISELATTSAVVNIIGTSDEYTLSYKETNSDEWIEEGITVNDSQYELTGLTPLTSYTIEVTGVCEDGEAEPRYISFTTTMEAVELPYSTSFAEGEDVAWRFNNLSTSNYQWTIGSPSNVAPFDNALFVSGNGQTSGYNASSALVISAEKLFNVGDATMINIEFDAVVGGETSWDYLKIFFADASVEYPAGATQTYAEDDYTTNAILFDGDAYLSETEGQTVHVSRQLANPSIDGLAKLVFVWKNDDLYTNDSKAASISNINVYFETCLTPTTVLNIDETSVSVEINGNGDSYTVEYKAADEEEWTVLEGQTSEVTITGLTASTTYNLKVYYECEDGEMSPVHTRTFTTDCSVISDFPWNEDVAGDLDCWRLSPITSEGTWGIVNNADYVHGGLYAFAYFYTPDEKGYLVFPPFDLTSLETPALSFFYNINQYYGVTDSFAVAYKSSVEDAWTIIQGYGEYTNGYLADTIILPNPSATYKIAFLGVGRDGNSLFIDDISVFDAGDVEIPCTPTTATVDTTVCSNELPFSWNGQQVTGAGTFTYTTTNAGGCEHVITLNVAVNQATTETIDSVVCSNELPFQWNGQTITAAGIFTYNTTNAEGCNHTITMNLTVNQTSDSTLNVAIEAGQSYVFNGETLSVSTVRTATFQNALGCDSTVTLILTVGDEQPCIPTSSSVDTTVCQTALPFTWNGVNVPSAGQYTYTTTNAEGCDSTVTLTVLVNAISTASVDTAVCATALPFTWNGQNVEGAGAYTYTTTNAAGCDSVVTLNVVVNATSTAAVDTSVCATALPFTWNGQNVTGAGEVTYTTTNEAGCEHVITLTVNVYEQTARDNDTVILRDADLPYTHESGLVCEQYTTYHINAVDENGCAYEYNLVVLHDAGLMDAEANMSVALYPNPTSGNATLSIEGLTEDATILVTDVQGRVISTSVLTAGETTSTIETNTLPAGVYYVRVLTATTTNTQKLIRK